MDMALSMDNIVISNEEEISMMKAMHLPCGVYLNMVLKAAIELDLFEIIAKSTTQKLSSYEITSQIPTKNPNASLVLERILSFHLKDAILEGEIPFNKAHGVHAFEYNGKDSRMNEVFNKAMQNLTCIEMKRIVECYNGFQGVKEIIDVGGGLGISLASIISKYPNIKGTNFDLPFVIKDAPTYEGIEHVGGDMLKSVPQGELIILKAILHNWDDDDCVKILKNCWRALPNDGKVVCLIDESVDFPLIDAHA
ncbi:hypothetical protein KY290_029479 [Solanum tuberosum]|uniref:O-methyltransferase C-terminal domain-containing protein n=1 Tax=Solanum tuberosum TaxID=4113 RepID=A0ABQ7UMW0_SOLTU|nr:hypothetical protein KY284_028482 [Solanum tuberosum]KAH0750247.1 hypothetical protein KY290_029479 [Solanum tuberosum]